MGDVDNAFGTRLRQLRKSRGWRLLDVKLKLNELGVTKGASVQHLSEVERGDPVSGHVAKALDNVFGEGGRLLRLLVADRYPQLLDDSDCEIDLHIFYPARVGGDIPSTESSEVLPPWNISTAVTIRSEPDEQIHLFPYGVAVLHRRLPLGQVQLQKAAQRRNAELARGALAVQDFLTRHGLDRLSVVDDRPYGFSCFVLSNGRDRHQIRQVTRLLANPNQLWPFYSRNPSDVESNPALTEAELLASEPSSDDLAIFDVGGSHCGAASWAAVTVHRFHEGSDIDRLLIAIEIQLQAFWCYASYVQRHASCLPGFESQFLRSSLRQLAAPDPLEHSGQRLLREALVTTSRITQLVEHALGAIRIAS